jgi:hypothetical protein
MQNVDKETEHKQWTLCPFCGGQKTPDESIIAKCVEGGMPVTDARAYAVQYHYSACPNAGCAKLNKHAECLRMPFVDGAYYHGICRNARVARYVAATNRFVYMREKFGAVFPEGIGHAENDNGFDLFKPFGLLETPPFDIPQLTES